MQELEAAGGMEHDAAAEAGPELQAVQRAAAKRQREFDRSAAEAAAAGSGFSYSSRRAFFKEFVKVWRARGLPGSEVLPEYGKWPG